MILIAYNMINKSQRIKPMSGSTKDYDFVLLISIGFFSGILTGILGIGGGFIIMPALVWYGNVSVRMSVGTSLLIIAFNSFSGFIEVMLEKHAMINYPFLFSFSLLSIVGIYLGFRLSLKLDTVQLKKMFGWFMMVIGIVVFIYESLKIQ